MYKNIVIVCLVVIIITFGLEISDLTKKLENVILDCSAEMQAAVGQFYAPESADFHSVK